MHPFNIILIATHPLFHMIINPLHRREDAQAEGSESWCAEQLRLHPVLLEQQSRRRDQSQTLQRMRHRGRAQDDSQLPGDTRLNTNSLTHSLVCWSQKHDIQYHSYSPQDDLILPPHLRLPVCLSRRTTTTCWPATRSDASSRSAPQTDTGPCTCR